MTEGRTDGMTDGRKDGRKEGRKEGRKDGGCFIVPLFFNAGGNYTDKISQDALHAHWMVSGNCRRIGGNSRFVLLLIGKCFLRTANRVEKTYKSCLICICAHALMQTDMHACADDFEKMLSPFRELVSRSGHTFKGDILPIGLCAPLNDT